jgi:transporter family protein
VQLQRASWRDVDPYCIAPRPRVAVYAHKTVTESTWFYWALMSAVFAALTAIFAKLGLTGIDSDLATLLRTIVIVMVLGAFVIASGKWLNPVRLNGHALLFLVLSALATGASWVCYFRALKLGEASRVAPVDKLSVVLVAVFAVIFLGERPLPRDWFGIALVTAGALILGFK